MNMNKEYRKELAALQSEANQLVRGSQKIAKKCQREIQRLQREMQSEQRHVNKQLIRIAKRRAVLEGRLS